MLKFATDENRRNATSLLRRMVEEQQKFLNESNINCSGMSSQKGGKASKFDEFLDGDEAMVAVSEVDRYLIQKVNGNSDGKSEVDKKICKIIIFCYIFSRKV